MPEVLTHHRAWIRNILKATTVTRDALPYSDEFELHFAEFAKMADGDMTRHQFWRSLSSAAKKGGCKGKKRGEPAPFLGRQEEDALRVLFAGHLGERDSLPYTSNFDSLRQQFNQSTGLSLSDREFWRAVCSVCKQSLRDDVERLLTQAVDSLTNAVDHFNGSTERGRPATVLILLEHACEMLLKAGLIQRGCDIRVAANGYTLSFEQCLQRATEGGDLKFLNGNECAALRVLNGLRDQAQHFLVDVSEQILYTVAQSTVTLFAKLVASILGVALGERLPRRVLPLSTDPPRTIHIVMDDEYSQLKKLLARGDGENVRVEAKLRCLLAMDRALNGQPTHVPTTELETAKKSVAESQTWDEVFTGISRVRMTADGSGVGIALTISKNEGIPVRVVRDGEQENATIAVRKINNTDFYCFGVRELSKRLKLGEQKTLALIWRLDVQKDKDCFAVFSLGKSKFKMYSQNALAFIQAELSKLDVDAVYREYRVRTKSRN